MKAANTATISIDGAIVIRLSGHTKTGQAVEAATMVYISPEANSFFLSKEAMIQLGIIPQNFPELGQAFLACHRSHTDEHAEVCANIPTNPSRADCSCLLRKQPPGRPDKLSFACTQENTDKIKDWLLNRYASSTFNKCPHQILPTMEGPAIQIHVDPKATPIAIHTPAPVPLHWQEQVERDLQRDVALGVLERVPHGEPTKWCFRMVITRKHDGQPRRTVDLSPLNKFCERETHSSKSPLHLARSVPPKSVKTVFDVWNGYHSVPI